MLYSFKGAYPQPLPFRIRLSDGRVRTDPTTFSEIEILDAGYVLVPDMPTVSPNQAVSWSALGSWEVRDKTEEELYQEFMNMVPNKITLRQAKLALLQSGLLDSVNSIINSMEGVEGQAARIEWDYAKDVERNSPLVNNLAIALTLSEKQVCDLFIEASQL